MRKEPFSSRRLSRRTSVRPLCRSQLMPRPLEKDSLMNLIKLLDEKFDPKEMAIIVDEVHRSGAPTYRSIFKLNAFYRLGLSATPEREWDEIGNQEIFEYFGPSVYEYSLEDAIKDDKLSPYEYYIHVV